jgi:3D (Asp-Asp-Asp) domain-containing protein
MKCFLVTLLVAVVFASLGYHSATIDSFEEQIATREQDIATLLGQLERDDDILSMIFGEWDRTKPVLSTKVTVTAYTSRPEETDDSPHWTADGSLVKRGIIAVSRDILNELGIRYGQRVVLEGYGAMEVRDTMNPRWTRRVDIWSSDLTAARLHGKKEDVTMLWVGK